ncbi:sigma factor-like helix-turn-helix DNA-binding protein [Enorma phocaeensis]|uniref:sigma factor-like helix-turn-helix DNA-binding protein n=1 Tax=Enorma phocaeensis TaxID=1871019 RepID=UPI003207F648
MRGVSIVVVGLDGPRAFVEVGEAVADALRDMRREAWRIERREVRHTLGLDAMGPFAASTGPELEPGFGLLSKCRTDELAAALAQLPAVQLRRLLMHAVAQLPVREIALREGCSERAVKYSLARARRRMRALLTDGD